MTAATAAEPLALQVAQALPAQVAQQALAAQVAQQAVQRVLVAATQAQRVLVAAVALVRQ